jgi:hypothetical protein
VGTISDEMIAVEKETVRFRKAYESCATCLHWIKLRAGREVWYTGNEPNGQCNRKSVLPFLADSTDVCDKYKHGGEYR